MERQPGETTGELKKRIITRNLIAGEYSRKDLKDHLLQKFPDCASCAFLVNNQPGAPALVIIVKKADTFVNGSPIFNKFTDEELAAIYAEAIRYIDPKYRVTIKNKEGCFETASGKSVAKSDAITRLDKMAQAIGELIDKENTLLTGVLKSDKQNRKE